MKCICCDNELRLVGDMGGMTFFIARSAAFIQHAKMEASCLVLNMRIIQLFRMSNKIGVFMLRKQQKL